MDPEFTKQIDKISAKSVDHVRNKILKLIVKREKKITKDYSKQSLTSKIDKRRQTPVTNNIYSLNEKENNTSKKRTSKKNKDEFSSEEES
jgi:hypothetical protein